MTVWPQGSRAQSHETALILGVRYPEPLERPLPYYMVPADSVERAEYRTFLLVADETGVRVAADHPGLRIPRGDGIWRADVKRSVYNNWVEDFVWSAPPGHSPALPGIQAFNGENCTGHRVQVITFASATHLGVEQRSAGYCEDAAHPWFSNTLAVVPIDSTDHTGVSISAVLGRPGRDAIFNGAQRLLTSLSAEDRDQFYPHPDEANWAPMRRRGQWVIRGRLDSDEVSRPLTADFVLRMRIPPTLLGYEERPLDWERIVRRAPDAIDALTSPSRDLVVISRPGRITLHRLAGSDVQPAVLSVSVPDEATIVMSQWTTSQTAQWIRAMSLASDAPVVGWKPAHP